MSSANHDLAAFVEFARHHLTTATDEMTPEALILRWRAERERAETLADIERGIADYEAGLAQPIDEAFRELRQKFGFTP